MKITLKLEQNIEQGAAEYRFYLVFEDNISSEKISALFNRKGFQCPEIVKKDNTHQVFLNKRIPEPFLVKMAKDGGHLLLEDYSIVQALDILSNNLSDNFELDQNAIETLKQSKNLTDEMLKNLQETFGDELTEDYYSPFIGVNIGLTDEFIEKLEQRRVNEDKGNEEYLHWRREALQDAEHVVTQYAEQIQALPVQFGTLMTVERIEEQKRELLKQLEDITLNKEDLIQALKTLNITGQSPKIHEAVCEKTQAVNAAAHEQQSKVALKLHEEQERQKQLEKQQQSKNQQLKAALNPYQAEFNSLLSQLKETREFLVQKAEDNSQYETVATRVTELYDTLEQEMNAFFTNPTAVKFQQCHERCKRAINVTVQEAAQHRGWHAVDPIIRGIIGVLAAIAIVPALIVEATSKHGYIQTFFAQPVTDTSEKIAAIKTQFNEQKAEFENQENEVSSEIRSLKISSLGGSSV